MKSDSTAEKKAIMLKIRLLVNIHYHLQSSGTTLLKELNHKYGFLDPNYDDL